MADPPFDLSGQVVLVVGAGSGIGAARARLACALGAEVLPAGRPVPSLEAIRGNLVAPARARLV
jgi:NAD(P)-dependent dehydrogenase (short-subunit alcohol dehydrogenase family)